MIGNQIDKEQAAQILERLASQLRSGELKLDYIASNVAAIQTGSEDGWAVHEPGPIEVTLRMRK